jgi:competence protein ComEA
MFGRPTSPDRDAVSAAQRRLASIAAQFAAGSDDGDDAPSAPAEWTTPPSSDPGRHVVRSSRLVSQRLTLSAHHVAVICLAAVVMIVLAAWWVLRSAPHVQPVQLSSERTLPSSAPAVAGPSTAGAPSVTTPSGGAPAPTTSTAASVVVDVAGKVRSPGIVRLPAGSRVVDALKAAGGARSGVGTRSLNLARPLVDGEQIVVGLHVPALSAGQGAGDTLAPSTSASIAPVDLNTATAEQLDTLPGIGPVTAQAILTWRTENGSFSSVDELLEVSGIGDATLADIAPYVYV